MKVIKSIIRNLRKDNLNLLLFFSCICLLIGTLSLKADESINAIAQKTAAVNQAKVEEVETYIQKANTAYLNKEYPAAKEDYLKAISIISNSPKANSNSAQKKIAQLTKALSNVYTEWSQELLNQAKENNDPTDLDKSIELCMQAKEMNPHCSDLADRLISYYKEMKNVINYEKTTSVNNLIPNNKEKMHNIDVLYEQGKLLYGRKMYSQSKDKFYELLAIDPYNVNAIEYLRLINLEIVKTGNYRTAVTATDRAAEVEWKKLSPIMSRTLSGERVDLLEDERGMKKMISSPLKEKLDSIILKNLTFESVPIDTVVAFLKNESKIEDPTGQGVNFVLKLAPLPMQSQAGQQNQPAAPRSMADIANQYQVTIVLENVTLARAVDYVVKSAGLNYRVDKYAVIIFSENAAETSLETEVIPVEREVFIDVIQDNKTTNMIQYFKDRGIQFDAGTSCVYDPKISRLVIRNTQEQIDKVSSMIAYLENTLPQVSILAKFVEMRQKDYEELGFEWKFSRASNENPSWLPNDQLNRYADDPGVVSQTGVPDKEFGFLYSSNGLDIEGTMHALNQNERVEVLSAPRVTTLSGQKATIRLVTDRYFPTNWTEPELQNTQTTDADAVEIFTPATPEVSMSTSTPLGIRLDVTPHVSSDNYTIDMVLEPKVQDFVGWTYYTYTATDTEYDSLIYMPEISARTIQTQLRIYDGETVVMGGVLKDSTTLINDNVPILSDLPLVGRMFQSTIEVPDKTNLLIFTTVQLIRPDGTPLRPSRNAGLPSFRD